MDKYTVDLDQVLNDFEYSELTDQQHSKRAQASGASFHPPPVTKHSINNVLNSLNEYLNSDISGSESGISLDSKTDPIDNKLAFNNETKADVGNKETDQDKDYLNSSLENVKAEKPADSGLIPCDDQQQVVSDVEVPREVSNSNDPFDDLVKTESQDFPLLEAGETQLVCLSDPNCTENLLDVNKQVADVQLECDRNVIVALDNDFSVQKEDTEEVTEPILVNTETISEKTEDIFVDINEDTVEKCKGEPTGDNANFTIESEHKADRDLIAEETALDNNRERISSENCEEEDLNPPDHSIIKEPESLKMVGFSTDIEIDDCELHKMLEDLELEVEDQVDVKLESTPELTDCNPVVSEIGGTQLEEDDVVKCQENEELHNEQANTSGDKQVVNEESTKETPQVLNREQMIECLEIEKPIKSRKKPPLLSNEEGQESITTIEQTQETIEDQSEEELRNENPDRQSEDALTRPQDLPLNNATKSEELGRKINLIGSPGSTPYNNVYVNKSIVPKASQDVDGDYASSASPTFSDCSTESSSTASTVSVEDKPIDDRKTKDNLEEKSEQATVDNTGDKGALVDPENQTAEAASAPQQQQPEDRVAEAVPQLISINDGGDAQTRPAESRESFLSKSWLGKEAPLWIPDGDAAACMHCDMKFTVLKRRHHCRACGLVLCSKCCNLKYRLEYLDAEARVCNRCFTILTEDVPNDTTLENQTGSDPGGSRPNPNNPLEYCSTVSPLQQIGQSGAQPPSVMVPVGVLKRKGSSKKSNKSVMFCDGIAPGSDLTNLDQDFNYSSDNKPVPEAKAAIEPEVKEQASTATATPPAPVRTGKISRNVPKIDPDTKCFMPKSEDGLPPTVSFDKTDILYTDCSNTPGVVEMLKNESLVFALNQNLFVHVKIIDMSCCVSKLAWSFSTDGLINVGSDEIVYLIEYIEDESFVPKDVFSHVHNVYLDACMGTSVKEMGLSLHDTSNFLDSRNHAGFVYIKPTFQCLERLILPKEPYLVGILIHRWETPWAKLFPLRLILRLGAQYRYYPSPLISTRHRDSVFVEIGHTIINLLADFRNFTYTLPQIRGLIIHMEDKKTTITIPKNCYEQVIKSINNSSEHILAFAGNFSPEADSHLVCIQDTQGRENGYTTHAINIHNKPRKVTGASFIVFNGSLKSSSGLTAKSNIVEDGLMIQIPAERMDQIRNDLRNMKNHSIACGCVDAVSDEVVNIIWGENDSNFNVGIKSPVDLRDMKGVPSIRVHNSKEYASGSGSRRIRWTEVFILQNSDEQSKAQDPVDVSKVSESISKACCTALVKYLDLLVSIKFQKIGVRVTLQVDNVSYSAGSEGKKLPPIYMRSLDDELIPVLHRITSNNLGDNVVILELLFRILNA